jgi:peptidoglycan hydrolase-like protein with peptidoglycan-binding domain
MHPSPKTLLAALATTVAASLLTGLGTAPASAAAAPASAAPAPAPCQRTLATYPVLHRGDHRPAVRTLQCLLNDDGYGPLTVDGRYGKKTRAAILEVESTFEGVPAKPFRIGRGMWTLLIARTLPDATLHLGDQGHEVVVLQRALRAGGGTLAVDGDFGPQTRAAVQAFQRHNHLRASGRVNPNTRFMLHQGAITRGRI